MQDIKIIDPEYNFWDIYPEFKKVDEFKFIQKEYKSKSSDVMWFIVACFDLDSKFFNLEEEVRTELLSKDYLNDKSFYEKNKLKLLKAKDRYEQISDTTIRRQLRQLIETMQKRTKFLRSLEYDLDNFEKHDKMVSNTANLFKVFEIIEKQLQKEKGAGATKGNHELSLSDSDEI